MLGTKAQTLIEINNNIEGINVLPILVVESEHFFRNKEEVIKDVINFANGKNLIIRSSSMLEDTSEFSNAGKFESLLNVKPIINDVEEAIVRVYGSYNNDSNEEILIQPMLKDIVKSGVVFTKDIDTGADYYVVNYYEGDDTAAVTGGNNGNLKTYVRYKKSYVPYKDNHMKSLIEACELIENYFGLDSLDIEFAIDLNEKVYILQARPLARGEKEELESIDLAPILNRIYKKAKKLNVRHPFLLGKTTCFGVMPDWNPAEILGARPKKLAISLYKELITDNIWAHQRSDYGYRDLTMHPLMISFCGVPYIDTRITFNSFIPKNLNPRIAEKLVNYYLDKMSAYPKYHDKIEFEIVFSCYYLGLPSKLKELLDYGFNENEITRIEFSLLELTNNIIKPKGGLYLKDIKKIKKLEENYDRIINSDISLVDKIYWLIEECKTYGTLPFAGIARAGFIAVQFLESFVNSGLVSSMDYNSFMNSLDTINKQMNADYNRYHEGLITKEEFLDKYGHIRPGTYDILSKRYDEGFDEYFSSDGVLEKKCDENYGFEFSSNQMLAIQTELEDNGLLISAEEIVDFIKTSIEGREYLKFVFTKTVSQILKYIEELGNRVGISKEDMAYLDIFVVKQLYVDLFTGNVKDIFENNIEHNKIQYEGAIRLKLPSIIIEPEDVYAYYLLSEEPNYITQKNIKASTIEANDSNDDLSGKVVFIRSADPGYDYIFSKNIAGLITQFGGANSHMAIRCAELGIPAVIGVGESRYNEWIDWKQIKIDCLMKQVVRIE